MSLTELLSRIKRGPNQIHDSGEGGAVVALALHCLMVKAGFQITLSKSANSAAPASDWNSKYSNEWVFEYSRRGFDSTFVLHCSLATPFGKMFVQGREADNPKNMHNLGLQVDKYVADKAKLQSDSWQGVLEGEAVLEEMFNEYIVSPLIRQAVPLPGKSSSSALQMGHEWLKHSLDSTSQQDFYIPIGIGVASLGIAAICFYLYRRRPGAT